MSLRPVLIALAGTVLLPACIADSGTRLPVPVEANTAESQRIISVLLAQQAAWNDGDIDGFMRGYWRSDRLRFASGGSVTMGWQATRDRYHARYNNRAIMGTLTFSGLEVDLLSADAAVVHGRWELQRDADQPSGLFTLVMKRVDGDWKVVSDTTTSAD